MRATVRWTNLACAALLSIGAVWFLIFLPESILAYAREPEDVWLGGFWVLLLVTLAALCFANAKWTAGSRHFGWLAFANLAAIGGLAALLVSDGGDDPALFPLVALCGLGPAVALLANIIHMRVQRS